MRNILKFVAVVVIAVAAVFLAKRFLGESTLPDRPNMGGQSAVEVAVAGTREFSARIEAIGTAKANESVTITASVSERVHDVQFKDGADVKGGVTLVQLENAEEKAQFDEAEVNLHEQRRKLERVKALREKQMVSEEELDIAQSAMKAAEAQLAAAKARLDELAIKAPFEGVLGIRQISAGALMQPGTVITTLDDLRLIKLDFAVPERWLGDMEVGQIVDANSVAWPGEVFTGTVASIDSRVDPTTRAVTVQAQIPNKERKLRPGMLLVVTLTTRSRQSVAVPEKALVAYADKQYAFVVKSDGTVQQREVSLGQRETGWVEISSGIEAGETVVVDGVMDLKDGSPVRVVNEPATASVRETATSSHSE